MTFSKVFQKQASQLSNLDKVTVLGEFACSLPSFVNFKTMNSLKMSVENADNGNYCTNW